MKLLNNTISLFFSFVTMAAGLTGIAQNETEQHLTFLSEVYSVYNSAKSYQMDVEVSLLNTDNQLIFPKQKNTTIKINEQFFIQTPELTTIQTEEFQIIIDNASKNMRYLLFTKEQQENFKQQQNAVIPSFTEMGSTVSSITKNLQKTTVVFKETSQYKSVVYTFNTSTKLLEQVDYYTEDNEYGQPYHTQITYLVSSFNEDVDTSKFELSEYVLIENSVVKPSNAYNEYQLSTNRITQ